MSHMSIESIDYSTRVTELLRETKFDLQIQDLYDLRMAVLHDLDHGSTWIQVRALDEDGAAQNGRKWYVPPVACDSEIVMTAFNAWLAYLEHEAREAFTFRDTQVASPHWDVADLAANPPARECRA